MQRRKHIPMLTVSQKLSIAVKAVLENGSVAEIAKEFGISKGRVS